MNVTLKQIEAFVWLAALRNFRRVAEQVNTTQPNISLRLAALEQVLDIRLFERDAGSVGLTDQGRSLLPLAERVVQAVEALQQASGHSRQQATLRLGVTETVAQSWLHDFMKQISERMPNIILEVAVDLSLNLQRGLLERSFDLAFLNGPISDLAVTNLPLGTVALIWVAAPSIATQIPRVATAAELSRFPVLTHARNTRPYTEVVDYLNRGSGRRTRPLSSSNLAACLKMTRSALGIATLPPQLVRPFIASGELVALESDWLPTPMNFTASYFTAPSRPFVEAAAVLAREVADWDKVDA